MTDSVQLSLLYREIPLTGKAGAGKVALVDEEDYAYLSQFFWNYLRPSCGADLGHVGYALTREKSGTPRKPLLMHNLIMQPPPGYEVDHIHPGNGLDNRRCNLRLVDHPTNCRNLALRRNNTSGFRGVKWHTFRSGRSGAWEAAIRVRGRCMYLGLFPTAEEASVAYEAAHEHFAALGTIHHP